MFKRSVEEIKRIIKKGIFGILIKNGKVTGRIDIYAMDMNGRLIKSLYLEDGKIVKAYTFDSCISHNDYHLNFFDVEIKEDFCFYHDGDVLLFTYHDEGYFTIDEI